MTGTIHVLLIEDDDADALLVEEMLSGVRDIRYKISRAPALEKGIAMSREDDIDVVLLDLNLPDAQGLDTVKAFLGRGRQKPVIAMTGLEDGKTVFRAIELGVQNYLIKGRAGPETLSRVIRGAIEKLKTGIQIKESEQKFRLLFNKNADAMIIVDEQGDILFMNPAAEALFKRPKEELIGSGFGFPVETGIVSEMDVVRPDGTLAVAEIRSSPIVWEKTGAFLLTLRDMTDRKRLEAELARARKMEALGILAGGVAHDFNNILSIVFGFVELCLAEAEKGTELEENLNQIHDAGVRAKNVVSQILTYTRQGVERSEIVKVRSVVEDTLELFKHTLPADIEAREEIDSQASIMGDPGQLYQIVMNLCTNAVQAMENGGRLTVGLTDIQIETFQKTASGGLKPGDYVRLDVSDTGIGILPYIRDRIFEPYFTTRDTGKGTGLGLAVVHGIVKKYMGAIRVKSGPGEGSRFSVFLPVCPENLNGCSVGKKMSAKKNNILFVSRDTIFIETNERLLSLMDYTVISWPDSTEALEIFCRNPEDFDLVIIDMGMLTLAEKMLEIRQNIPILLFSGSRCKTGDKKTQAGTMAKIVQYNPSACDHFVKKVQRILEINTNPPKRFNP